MKYSVDKQELYTIFSLNEENLNATIAPDLKSEFVILRNEGVKNIIFDLAKVKFVDSSGLSAILTGDRLWKNKTFVLTAIKHDSVKRLLSVTQLDSKLKIVPTIEESVGYVLMEEVERNLAQERKKYEDDHSQSSETTANTEEETQGE